MNNDSLLAWLIGEVREIVDRQTAPPPLLLWCDPHREWLDLLRVAAKKDKFELWAPAAGAADEHEMVIRDRFFNSPRAARVVWLPCSRDDITWFKPFELEAEYVWEKSLLEGLREYGVYISREHESAVLSLLPAHAREWLDKPMKTWEELTPANAKGALVDDHRMLQVLSGTAGEFDQLRAEERFDIFARRATEDFGLPNPQNIAEQPWRVSATARLLSTEAAEAVPSEPPSEGEKIIPTGLARKRSMDLLKAWQNHVRGVSTFEQTARAADATVGLAYWAKNLTTPPRSRSSRQVEKTIFDQFVDRLDRVDDVELLAQELERNLQAFKFREAGFWEQLAVEKTGWRFLVQLADAASLLVENKDVEKQWKNVAAATQWYSGGGWQLDLAGERLFQESPDLPAQLHRIRARMRRGYLRSIDRIGRAFSQLLAKNADALAELNTAGEAALAELERQSVPTAIMFLDACRLDLGQRLAGLLNKGEPVQRATVAIAAAPVPSVTALGMAFALPMTREALTVLVAGANSDLTVMAKDFAGDLARLDQRRQWLGKNLGIKDHLGIDEVLDGETLKKPSKSRKLIAVYGADFDRHDGELQLTGADAHLDRYVQAIRRLRDNGYSRVVVVTDHGFFHWDPEDHEIADKPAGKLLWMSRRAIVGRNLSHPQAVHLRVPCSDLWTGFRIRPGVT